MKSIASRTPARSSPGMPQGIGARQADGEIDRVVGRAQRLEPGRAVEAPAELERDAADREQPVDLGLGEVAGHLVRRQTVFVEAAGARPGIVDHRLVAEPRQAEGARQPGRAGADDGDAPAGRRGAAEERRSPGGPSPHRPHSAAAGRSRPACPAARRARRPARTALRSGRRGRRCRRADWRRGWCAPRRAGCLRRCGG